MLISEWTIPTNKDGAGKGQEWVRARVSSSRFLFLFFMYTTNTYLFKNDLYIQMDTTGLEGVQ